MSRTAHATKRRLAALLLAACLPTLAAAQLSSGDDSVTDPTKIRLYVLLATHSTGPMVDRGLAMCSRELPGRSESDAAIVARWHQRNDADAALAPLALAEFRAWTAAKGDGAEAEAFIATDFPQVNEGSSNLIVERLAEEPADGLATACDAIAAAIDAGKMDIRATLGAPAIAHLDGLRPR